jgi:electron transport complex protein RnfG
MTDLSKPVFALVIVTVVAAVLLGFVHDITLKSITAQNELSEAVAIASIFENENITSREINIQEGLPVKRVQEVMSGSELVGYIFHTSPIGYAGEMNLMVGIDSTGVIRGVKVLQHTETPGLGNEAVAPAFTNQFKGKSSGLVITRSDPIDNEIQAVSGATITSSAIVDGVNEALEYFQQMQSQ